MALPDLTDYTPEELRDLLNAVINEQERRQRLELMPGQIAAMAQQFVDGGGDRAALVEAVSQPVAAPEGETSGDPQE